ncbi:MAG: hypothetical protein JXR84_13110 [Anaerolineae bacterium]|nr:hypothetical protein [Anaerolineae bacterium]
MKKRLFVIAGVLVLSFLAGCVTTSPGVSPLAMPTLPGSGLAVDTVDVPTLPDFLEMLAGPTGWVLLGAVLSALVAKWPWYNAQGDVLKRGLLIGGSMVIAILARLALTYIPATFWEQTAAYWYIIGGTVITWLGSQGWFQAMVKPQREKEREWRVLE